jgi:O-antigen/teichoic acid export membrane protein
MKDEIMSVTNKIIKNTGANVIGRFLDMAILMVTTPITYHYLGHDLFGIWMIIFVLTGYMTLMDFGIGQGFVRFVAEYHTQEDTQKINAVLSIGFFFYLGLGILLSSLLYLTLDIVTFRLFNIPEEYGNDARISMLIAFLAMMLQYTFSCFDGLINGFQRMELSNLTVIASRLCNFFGVLIVVYSDFEFKLVGLTINAAVAVTLTALINFFIAIKLFPELKISPRLFDKEIFKKLFSYGYKVQIVSIVDTVINSFAIVVFSHMVGLAAVAFYSLARRLAVMVKIMPTLFLLAVIPAVAELRTKERLRDIEKLYIDGSKYLAFITYLLIFGVIVIFPYFLKIWLGEEQPQTIYAFYFLAAMQCFNLAFTGIASSILRGIGKPELAVKRSILNLSLTIILSLVFVRFFGYYGVIWGMFLGSTLSTTYFYVAYHRMQHLDMTVVLKMILPPLLISVGIATVLHFLLDYRSISKMEAIYYIVTSGIAYLFFYLLLTLKVLKYFSTEEIGFILNKLKEFRKKRKIEH